MYKTCHDMVKWPGDEREAHLIPVVLEFVFKNTDPHSGACSLARQLSICHIIEHDLHHGGEVQYVWIGRTQTLFAYQIIDVALSSHEE